MLHRGKIFLFGGYTNKEYIKGRQGAMTGSYGDLWQLKIDIPGGYFEDVDIEEETRTARAGPWQRCFGCGNSGPGAGLKKCTGSPQKTVSRGSRTESSGFHRHMRRQGGFL